MASLAEEAAMALASRKGWVYVASMAQELGRISGAVQFESIQEPIFEDPELSSAETYYAVNMLAETHLEFTKAERKLLSSAYKNELSEKYVALRTISDIVKQEEDENHIAYASLYCEVLEEDMQRTCRDGLNAVQCHLLPFSRVPQNVALYNKMVGDIYWYLAMLKKEDDKEKLIDDALTAYESASKAVESLSPADPLRLAVYLTKTAFYHDVKNWPERACSEGKQALDKAGPELGSLGEDSHKESSEIIELMKENLTHWTNNDGTKISFALFGGATSSSSIFAEKQETSLKTTPYPTRSPLPAVRRSVVPDNFLSPGDWGYEEHEGISENQIRSRRKAAQATRGWMG